MAQHRAHHEFGTKYASQIADIISKYTKYNGRRKPELIAPDTFSLVDYQEADKVLAERQSITREAEQTYITVTCPTMSEMLSFSWCSTR